MGAPAPFTLRPLGVGEIIDRALTLYVQNFVPFTGAILVLVFVPLAIADFLLFASQAGEFQAFSAILHHTAYTPPATNWPELLLGYLMIIVAAVLAIFGNAAIAVNVAAVYTGRRPTVWSSLAVTFAQTGPLVGVMLFGALIAFGAYVLLALLGAAGAFAVIGSVAAVPALRSPVIVVLFVMVAVAIVFAVILCAALLALSLTFATYAAVIEEKGAAQAVASGFARIFNRGEWWKATLVMLVAVMLSIGISVFADFAQVLLAFVPGSEAIVALWTAAFGVLSGAVQTVFYAVYYYDVRIRREGFDLEATLARLSAATE